MLWWNSITFPAVKWPIYSEMADLMYKQHVIVINVGYAMTCEYKKEGEFRRFFKARGAISFFPSGQSFFLRSKLERGMFANVLFLALDPVFVSRIAEGLELDSEGIGLIERRRSTDPTLHHIAMALRAGVQSGDGLDRMYGEGPAAMRDAINLWLDTMNADVDWDVVTMELQLHARRNPEFAERWTLSHPDRR
jgi:hypothetical protein